MKVNGDQVPQKQSMGLMKVTGKSTMTSQQTLGIQKEQGILKIDFRHQDPPLAQSHPVDLEICA